MSGSSLDRLREHAQSFDGLLSLIPAKLYYGGDNSDQWKKKKQTKEEAAAARRAKLDPESAKTAKEIMDERAKKRKLDMNEDGDGDSDIDGIEREQPRQGMKEHAVKSKKQKTESEVLADSEAQKARAEGRRQKLEQKKERRAQKNLEKKERRDAKMKAAPAEVSDKTPSQGAAGDGDDVVDDDAEEAEEMDDEAMEEDAASASEMGQINLDGLEGARSTTSDSAPESPVFDANPSTNTSTSSIIPPATAPKHIKLPSDPELLRSRLAARIEALRAARKADGPNGKPARTRQELMEARRKKEEQRRTHKKELRLKAKAEEERKREEALASARDSPASTLMSPVIQSPEQNFSFGRVTFGDGDILKNDLSGAQTLGKRKGPHDAATALALAEKKKQRFDGLDGEKKADIEEKEMWLTAKKHARGERVRDDVSLLKKALKRKEKAKKKSEKEWKDRTDGVAKAQAMRQKKREDNLRKRRDEKGSKGKKAKAKKSKPKSRPGFEGSFASGKRH